MAEQVDAQDSKSCGAWHRGGSIPPPGKITTKKKKGARVEGAPELFSYPLKASYRYFGTVLAYSLLSSCIRPLTAFLVSASCFSVASSLVILARLSICTNVI